VAEGEAEEQRGFRGRRRRGKSPRGSYRKLKRSRDFSVK
jgi:hypothetical protein